MKLTNNEVKTLYSSLVHENMPGTEPFINKAEAHLLKYDPRTLAIIKTAKFQPIRTSGAYCGFSEKSINDFAVELIKLHGEETKELFYKEISELTMDFLLPDKEFLENRAMLSSKLGDFLCVFLEALSKLKRTCYK
ncbi:MAG: hypothetical protein K9G45_08820 [Bacteroidales bacterium]|nr:hypothetical protein [Bacteroidales bacterium]